VLLDSLTRLCSSLLELGRLVSQGCRPTRHGQDGNKQDGNPEESDSTGVECSGLGFNGRGLDERGFPGIPCAICTHARPAWSVTERHAARAGACGQSDATCEAEAVHSAAPGSLEGSLHAMAAAPPPVDGRGLEERNFSGIPRAVCTQAQSAWSVMERHAARAGACSQPDATYEAEGVHSAVPSSGEGLLHALAVAQVEGTLASLNGAAKWPVYIARGCDTLMCEWEEIALGLHLYQHPRHAGESPRQFWEESGFPIPIDSHLAIGCAAGCWGTRSIPQAAHWTITCCGFTVWSEL